VTSDGRWILPPAGASELEFETSSVTMSKSIR